VTVPTACTNGHTVGMEVTIYVKAGCRLQNIDGRAPARREKSENALTWPYTTRVASQADPRTYYLAPRPANRSLSACPAGEFIGAPDDHRKRGDDSQLAWAKRGRPEDAL
jgi:hypothetical protein